VEFTFPAGATIRPRGSVVIAKDGANFQGAGYPVFQWTDGKLRNEGEVIYLFDANGILVDFVRYNNHAPWPEGDELLGRSIEIISSSLDNHFAPTWRPSESIGGTPGEVLGVSGTVSIEKVLKLTIYPNPVSNELHVIGDLEGNEIYQLIGADGKVMQAGKLGPTINVHTLPKGFYILSVENNRSVGNINVIVNR
jgi:hypothetical protein